ncbi:hypothetical protein I2494_02515 [Budviciaceae bacterium BWR-B9]|uniref:ESPR domain-containing protein n=1 Tax=Limnobaculum allomyrinae TaxID=2791986 RepID=A0ABS1ILL9_9GAMM|nr:MULTISPECIES: hypothetical protein [Limnobaculum]MBK5142607.1 hypothetical protein [Limnobaculum allomyrinae]MBV7690507.1 hypothetical protein [Limnobaculum sp. M2-1]
MVITHKDINAGRELFSIIALSLSLNYLVVAEDKDSLVGGQTNNKSVKS